jgi:hypothetical protein
MNIAAREIAPSYEEKAITGSTGFQKNFATKPESLLALKGQQILDCFRKSQEESCIELPEELQDKTSITDGFSPPTILLPARSNRVNHMVSLQKWQGYVLKVLPEFLLVRLIDLTQKGADEEAEIPIDEISRDDEDLIKPGAIFYWNIGYLDSYTGQRTRVSVIRFQRLPRWSDEEIDAAKQKAKRLQEIIGWE